MLKCTKCKLEKDFSFFSKNKSKKTGYNFRCKPCHAEDNKISRHKKPEKYKKHRSDVREKYKNKCKEWKQSRGCLFCKENDPVCLDLHHLISEQKEKNVANIQVWSKFLIESAKCIVLCSNCHRKLHWGALPSEYQMIYSKELQNVIGL